MRLYHNHLQSNNIYFVNVHIILTFVNDSPLNASLITLTVLLNMLKLISGCHHTIEVTVDYFGSMILFQNIYMIIYCSEEKDTDFENKKKKLNFFIFYFVTKDAIKVYYR